MPVHCDIFSELNLIIYVCTGVVTPSEFFTVGDRIATDPRLKNKMKILIDFLAADLNTSVSDIHLAIQKNQEAKQRGQEVGQTAVLSTNQGLRYLGETLTFLSLDSIANFGIFHSSADAFQWLELPEEVAIPCLLKVREQA